MGTGERLLDSTVLEILQLTSTPKWVKAFKDKKGVTDITQHARLALEEDPYNIVLICNLGQIYAKDSNWEKVLNVLLRGWKRAGEIGDPMSRFFFLQKLAEASYRTKRYRQAFAALQDVGELPEELTVDERRSYYMLQCHVCCRNGDVARALTAFHNSLKNEEFKVAVRIFALVQFEMKQCGAYEAAKSTMDAKVGPERNPDEPYDAAVEMGKVQAKSDLQLCEDFLEKNKDNEITPKPRKHGDVPREVIYSGIALLVVLFCFFLYWLESRSLAKLGGGSTWHHPPRHQAL